MQTNPQEKLRGIGKVNYIGKYKKQYECAFAGYSFLLYSHLKETAKDQ